MITLTSTSNPGCLGRWVAAGLIIIVAACGSDGGDERIAEPVDTEPAVDGADTAATSSTEPAPEIVDVPPPDGIVASVELGYPRDLLDRGRVNVVTTNGTDNDLIITSRELVIDVFTSSGAEERRSTVPAGRQRMALQTLFGNVADCDDEGPVDASMVLTYSTGDDETVRRSALPIEDTRILDGIRAQTCTVRHVLEAVDISFGTPVVDDESIGVDAVFTRLNGEEAFEVTSVVGTVLIGAESLVPADVAPRALKPGEADYVLQLVFDVNRCDSHAVAETTKKFGLDLWISVDDAEAQRVPVPIDALLADFETILERCKARTGGE